MQQTGYDVTIQPYTFLCYAYKSVPSRGFANMVLTMAFDTKVISSSTSVVFNKKLPIAEERSRHFVAQ